MNTEAIVITWPVQFLFDVGASIGTTERFYDTQEFDGKIVGWSDKPLSQKEIIRQGYRMVLNMVRDVKADPDNNWWNHSMGTRPKIEVMWCYISILGSIRWKARIAGWDPGGEKVFRDGRKRFAKHWLILSDFIEAPHGIKFKGTQGFRYTYKLF